MYKFVKKDGNFYEVIDINKGIITTTTKLVYVTRENFQSGNTILINADQILGIEKIMKNLKKLFPDIQNLDTFFVEMYEKDLKFNHFYKFKLILMNVYKNESNCVPIFNIDSINI